VRDAGRPYLALFAPPRPIASPGFPAGGAVKSFVTGALVQLAMFSEPFGASADRRAPRRQLVERMAVTRSATGHAHRPGAPRTVAILLVQAVVRSSYAQLPWADHQPGGHRRTDLRALLGLIMRPFLYSVACGEERGRAWRVVNACPAVLRLGLFDDAASRRWLRGGDLPYVQPRREAMVPLRRTVLRDRRSASG